MKKIFILSLCFSLLPSLALAAPNIFSVSGIISDGNTMTLSGSNFGSNTAVGTSNLQWLGGNIENGTAGSVFSATGWTSRPADSESAGTYYNNSEKHSGNQSLIIDFAGDKYKGYFIYDRGTELTKVYFTTWVKAHWDGIDGGQWKLWRLNEGSSPTDSTPGIYWSNSYHRYGGTDEYRIFTNFPEETTSRWYSANPDQDIHEIYTGAADCPGPPNNLDKWMRMEVYMEGSTQGVRDGTFQYWVHEPGVAIRNTVNYWRRLMIYGADQTERIKYVIIGHFAGDGYSSLATWWDDVFVQVGTQARVEIGDASTWTFCTHREIQYPTAWQDNSISLTANQGSFTNGQQAYLYVVDSNGNVNANGYPVMIGSGSSDTTPPAVPTGVTII